MSIKAVLNIALALGLLYGLFTVGLPFLLALITAIFLEPVILSVMKILRLHRVTAASVICSLYTLLLLGLFYLLGLKVVTEVVAFWDKIPSYFTEANLYIRNATEQTQLFYESLSPDFADRLKSTVESALNNLMSGLQNALAAVSVYFINVAKAIPSLFIFFVVYVVAVYLFGFSLPQVRNNFLSLFAPATREKMEKVLSNLRLSVFGFLRAQLLISALTYMVALVGLLVLGVEYPLAIALLIIVVDILPILGTGSVLVPWAVYNLIIGNLFMGIGLIALFLAISIFRRIVEPKILGNAIGISALSVLISLYIGFQLAGMVGIFLGPLVVIVFQAMRNAGLMQNKIRLE